MPTDTSTVVVIGSLGILSILIFLLFKNKNQSNNSGDNNRKNVIIALKNPDIKYQFPLVHKENISHDTCRFRFELPSSKHVLGLPIGRHVYLTAYVNGELVKRPYTPVTSDDSQGYFDLVIKIYPNGKMTQYLDKLPMNHVVEVSGPSGNLTYKQNGLFDIRTRKPEPNITRHVRHIGLIAGGSGITPMYQLLKALLKEQALNAHDQHVDIKIWLLFANQTEQDILLRDDLEQLAHLNANQFKLWYTIDRESEQWHYSKGFINEKMLQEHMPPPSDDVLICICGPSPMVKFACLPNLHKLGYEENMIFCF
ncbi:unnamed protein product [Rotaria magnacalcarata]|uniref:NADH-cytochrome b5 reductase n=1 Tax=Rotaria magnacalcarata TaxID=392030 RepID=A0A819K5D4_9BILA|nr:unnamed protein product [Rotaria magnacalcarata]CAF1419307.1 unnamed protein product [Rotaria magnacalcarata]CAF2052604.1 unnamed protein product [Rotaria magnacalcarata]CAF2072378.1 unnamed protein product [Rotaria magnacalcarata]CAF2242002.1 unnamed protein product [Rotaria magnacalcarata]